MRMPTAPDPHGGFQAQFHRRWHSLTDPHVRALAWLLCAPDMLDRQAPLWQGKIAHLPPDPEIDAWLPALQREPAPLHRYLEIHPRLRLGRYAEKLMAFYFERRGMLAAHSVQVRDEDGATIGEFDFLLRQGAELLHWEFATKFYLLESAGREDADYFLGPSLADMLGTKIRKILERQLALGAHPAARALLPQPLAGAQALIKGWLFYHAGMRAALPASGLAADHCRGFWCALGEIDSLSQDAHYALLPRLEWLAPARVAAADCINRATLAAALARYFRDNSKPALVALVDIEGGVGLETERGFIVPDDWRQRAGERITALQRA